MHILARLPAFTQPLFPLLTLGAILLQGCDGDSPADPTSIGTAYTITNASANNEVVVYERFDDGTLDEKSRVSTGGNGSGPGAPVPSDPLASQGAVVLSPNGDFLFAVNAGSNSVSSFEVESDGDLTRADVASSGGTFPVSLTVNPAGDVLYVLNADGTVGMPGAGSIAGFDIGTDGSLSPIAGSVQPLSGAPVTAAAVIAFHPSGDWLAVTEKMTNQIVTYSVDASGVAGPPQATPSTGVTPFGAAFTSTGVWIVSNANVPVPNMPVAAGGSATSYSLDGAGMLSVITGVSPSFGTAACWIALTANDRFAYTTNTASSSISGYSVAADGSLTPLTSGDELVTLSVSGAAPLDMAIANGFLYTLAGDAMGGDGTISVHRIGSDGSLTVVSETAATGLPAFVMGLAVR